MKKTLILLALVLFGIAGVQAKTIIEGTIDSCQSKYDVFRYRLGVYQANVTDVNFVGDEINFNVDLKFLLCQEISEGTFKRIESDPMRQFSYESIIDSERSITVNVDPQELSIRFLKDGVYKLIHEVKLNSRDASQSFETMINMADILTEEEMDSLERDGVVTTHFSFFLVKKVIFTTEEYGEMKDTVSYSSFRKILEIRNTESGLKARIIQ